MSERKYGSFEEFWPFYVAQHRNPANRALHFVGTTLVLACALLAVRTPWFLAAAPTAVEGATPGKKLMGLTLTRPGTLNTREPIGPARAALRLVGITAGNILFVDLIVALLRDRRALHDLIADSIVVEAR